MKIFAAMYYDTDEFTYACEMTLGIYSTRELADERLLKWCEANQRDLQNAHVDEQEIDVDWEA